MGRSRRAGVPENGATLVPADAEEARAAKEARHEYENEREENRTDHQRVDERQVHSSLAILRPNCLIPIVRNSKYRAEFLR